MSVRLINPDGTAAGVDEKPTLLAVRRSLLSRTAVLDALRDGAIGFVNGKQRDGADAGKSRGTHCKTDCRRGNVVRGVDNQQRVVVSEGKVHHIEFCPYARSAFSMAAFLPEALSFMTPLIPSAE